MDITQRRVVRVFISSTFRDMADERETLVKLIFPELRRRCRERMVEFTGVDLRWGITDEQKSENKVLSVCLGEIEGCRPYFIGLLGERYGWVPEKKDIDSEIFEAQPWLAGQDGKSITELEVLHGVLNNPEMSGLAFFYFRNKELSDNIERLLAAEPGYMPDPTAAKDKLRILKDKIRTSGNLVRENYDDVGSFGKIVLEDLWRAIDARFPASKVPSDAERRRAAHEAFASERTKVYAGRKEYYEKLDAIAASDGPPLVILGESGSGKSSLMANWTQRYRAAHPGDFMVCHYTGGAPDSADHVKMLRRIMEEIKDRYGAAPEIPSDHEKVVEEFPSWLARAAAGGRFILVIDALNQIEDGDNALELNWLPSFFPANVRLILSTLPGRCLEALKKRGWPMMDIMPLGVDERRSVIVEYLGRYRKKLSDGRVDRIAGAGNVSNPLYLRTLLEELRVIGRHEDLDARIAHYLKADTVEQLFTLVLERLESDYETEIKGLAGAAMSLIWASRKGLSESEILDILGGGFAPMPRAHWSPLYLALEESLTTRGGLLNFFHDFLKKAVEARYLDGPEKKRLASLKIADYFEKRGLDDRKADELPWQLCMARERRRLKDCITDAGMFRKLYTDSKKYELTEYWHSLDGAYDMESEYIRMADAHERDSADEGGTALLMNEAACFLSVNARYDGAEKLHRRALAIREDLFGPDDELTAASLNNLALLLEEKGEFEEAEAIFDRLVAVNEKIFGPLHVRTVKGLNNLALLMNDTGRYDAAEPLLRRALGTKEKTLGPEHLDTALGLYNLAVTLKNKGDYDEAEALYRRALAVREKALGPEHPDVAQSLSGLGVLLQEKGEYDEAEALIRRAIEISKKILGPGHPDTALSINSLAVLLHYKGDYKGAEILFRSALEINENIFGPDHPAVAKVIGNLASAVKGTGDYAGAELLYRRAIEIRERALGPEHPETAISLNSLAALLIEEGDNAGAEKLCRRSLPVMEKAYGPEHPHTALNLNNLALALDNLGDREGAEPLYRRALAATEKALGSGHPNVSLILKNLGSLYTASGDHAGAESCYRRLLAIRENALGPDHVDLAPVLNNIGLSLDKKGDNPGAESMYRRALAIKEKAHGPGHADTATLLANIAFLVYERGDYAGAEPLFRRALAIKEKVLGPDHKSTRATRKDHDNILELLKKSEP